MLLATLLEDVSCNRETAATRANHITGLETGSCAHFWCSVRLRMYGADILPFSHLEIDPSGYADTLEDHNGWTRSMRRKPCERNKLGAVCHFLPYRLAKYHTRPGIPKCYSRTLKYSHSNPRISAIICAVTDGLIAFSTVFTLRGMNTAWRSTQQSVFACMFALS